MISEYIYIFRKLEHNYKIYTDKIMLEPILDLQKQKLTGFKFVSVEDEDDKTKKYIKDSLEFLEKSPDFFECKNELIINNHSYNNLMLFSGSFYNIVSDYFDDYLNQTLGIDYVLKQKEIYDNIFKQLEKMSKKNDWNEFHPIIFK